MVNPATAGDRWNLVAVLCAVVLAIVVPLLPLVSETSSTVDSSGTVVTQSVRRSLLEQEGAGVLAVASIPVVIAVFPMLGRSRRFRRRARIGASTVLALAAILAALSIGVFVVPTLVLMIVAATRSG
ncbi:MAG TPA: hypothetical protein ENI86_09070 [Acidimicrobiales bacterium]|nr:hypothetical protein [Acidimicrobiales bacterium]